MLPERRDGAAVVADATPEASAAPSSEARIPRATYRLQFNRHFTFEDAARIAPYLHALGVSDVYASSYFAARPGSLHGYDIVDHGLFNPEIGSAESYDRMVAALAERGMGQILDVVPNHMGIAEGANAWWNDVLENGRSSPYAEFFDIDWEPVEPHLVGKVLLPILGDQYGRALENQELSLELGDGLFRLHYYETALPVEPRSGVLVLRHGLSLLTAMVGEDRPDVQEYESIITALGNLPPHTETAPERVRERIREREVVRRRLHQLLQSSQAVRAALDETLRVFNGKRGDPRSFDLLDRLLSEQPYRLAHWRVAGEEINYRRFFDINELAAIRMEVPAVFRATHALILDLVAAGKITGLRIDHPDGLYEPRRYFLRLQRERFLQLREMGASSGDESDRNARQAAAIEAAVAFDARCGEDPAQAGCRPLYVVAEKILGRGERLPTRWAIHGTTGYEFMATIGGLFVDGSAARAMARAYASFTGHRAAYAELAYESKKLIMEVSMSSELAVLGHALRRLAEKSRDSRDFPRKSLTDALREVIASFPLYRTYIEDTTQEVDLQDRACIEVAVAFAKRRNPATSVSIFDFVKDVLLLRSPDTADDAYRREQRSFVQKFQQVTSPVTAKGVEDTAFYRYNRLVSLNEVGGEPEEFGVTVEEFHRQCALRQQTWPASLSATATHDTKRGEDVRARIHVLSEVPRAWRDAVRRWHRLNRRHTTTVESERAPNPNDEYLLYQTLLGAWPIGEMTAEQRAEFTARIQAYMAKASKEAKVSTSWVNSNAAYDEALSRFVERVLDPAVSSRFLQQFAAFRGPLAVAGMVNALAQALLKITAPGVPDFYQGTELWDLHLVDPDNRRPVDFGAREALLAGLIAAGGPLAASESSPPTGDGGGAGARAPHRGSLARELLESWQDGRVKLYVIHRALRFRRSAWDLFRAGTYVPLVTTGRHAAHVCAFARQHGDASAIVAVPRLTVRLTGTGGHLPLGPEIWADTAIHVPQSMAADHVDVLTGARRLPAAVGGGFALSAGDVFADLPVALLDGKG